MNAFAMQDSVLENQFISAQTRLANAQALDIVARGVGRGAASIGNALAQMSPAGQQAQNNAFLRDDAATRKAELENEQREREIISGLIEGIERAPEHLRPQAWAHAYGQAERMNLDLEGIPREFDAEVLQILQASIERLGIEMPASVQEFMFAQEHGGFEGTFLDWRQQSARGGGGGFTLGPGQTRFGDDGSVTASVQPKPAGAPAGYRLSADGSKYEFIPGGPADPAVIGANAQARGPSTQINVGSNGQQLPKPPPGFMYRTNPGGSAVIGADGSAELIPIRGGPAAADQTAQAEKAEGRRSEAVRAANVVVEDIGRSIGIIQDSNWPTTGLLGSALSNLPGSSANDLNKMLDTVKSNSGFDTLQTMRENSPTGGALGSVSERELSLLQSTIGSLEQSQGQQQVLDNLSRVGNVYMDIIYGAGNGPQRFPVSFREGDRVRRLDFLRAQYPNDPDRVIQIMRNEGLIQ